MVNYQASEHIHVLDQYQNLLFFSQEFIEWFVGFSDAESNFLVKINHSKKQVQLFFQIGLHLNDLSLLEFLKNKFNVGYVTIDKKKNNKANWVISSYNDINKIILPIFDSFPLNSSKHFNYVLFRTICDMMLKKEHLTEKGFQQIIKIKSQMNFKTSDVSILNNHSINITTPWLIGFI